MQGRRLTLLIVAAAHVAIVALLVTAVTPGTTARDTVAMTVFAVAAAPAVLPPTPPPPTEMTVATAIEVPVFMIAAPSAGAVVPVAGADGCGLTEAVAGVLRDNPAVGSALHRVPARSRSVANAIAVWNGQWVDAAAVGGDATFEVIRRTITDRIMAAPEACRNAALTGPRLVLLSNPTPAIIVSIGSGVWAWGQLLD